MDLDESYEIARRAALTEDERRAEDAKKVQSAAALHAYFGELRAEERRSYDERRARGDACGIPEEPLPTTQVEIVDGRIMYQMPGGGQGNWEQFWIATHPNGDEVVPVVLSPPRRFGEPAPRTPDPSVFAGAGTRLGGGKEGKEKN